ncbi:MAG: tail fiber domain-containing protein [Acidobacteria bacterium]|nr:tail fiber domain-containing protein [Acidobacteriota bacterium]
MRSKHLTSMSSLIAVFMAVLSPLALAQSGAPNLLQFHGRLVDPMTSQSITTPTQIWVQIIQGGTAEENPTAGRVVFSEQADVTPDDTGAFDYLIGSHTPGVGTGRARLDAEDFNTTGPVFVEIALVHPNGSVQVLLPRQRLVSVPYALQAADAAISTDATLMGNGTSETPLGIADGGVGTQQLVDHAVTAAKIAPGQVVKSLNGLFDNVTLAAGSNITITPAANTLTIAAPNALSSVSTNNTLMGNGTSGMPLGVAVPLSLSGSTGVSSAIITADNSGSGRGVAGICTGGIGVFGSGGTGVIGSGSGFGVEGITDNSFGAGVRGFSSSGIGVRATSSGDLFSGDSGGTVRFRVDNDGDVFAKSYMPISDARRKTHIQPLTEALEKLQHIRGVSYEWTDVNPSPAPREIGVIAQEVEPVFPELVKPWGDQGYKGVSYDGLTAVLLEGVKALKAENDALRAELESLRQMLNELKVEMKKSGH